MKFFYCLVFILVITGCEQSVINQGYDIETADFEDIKPGIDNVTTVFQKLGSPTTRSTFGHSTGNFCWYYAAKHMKKFGFMNPKLISQQTYVITFSKEGKVVSINKTSYEKNIKTVKETTKAKGKNRGFLKETFGGMGKNIERFKK